ALFGVFAAISVAGIAVAVACGGGDGPPRPTAHSPRKAGATTDSGAAVCKQYCGATISPTFSKPDITLTDTSGKPFNVKTDTAGVVTLLYVGYTHCPDICPTHMQQIAKALKALPAATASKVKVVFITSDPERDTPAVLRKWLDNFDTDF